VGIKPKPLNIGFLKLSQGEVLVSPWMFSSLIVLPKSLSIIVMIVLVVAGIAEHRQGHIGRVAIAGNAFLLWQIFFGVWDKLPDYFQWYLNLGTVVAIIAIVSYVARKSLPSGFYQFSYLAYGSFSVLLTFIFAFEFGLFTW
jgi:hypothetical protein